MIRAEKISFNYTDLPVLKGVSLLLDSERITGILGPNGAGKSTLMKLLAGIIKSAAGSIRIHDREISRIPRKELARCLAFVGQTFASVYNYSVSEIVLMGRFPHLEFPGRLKEADHFRVHQAMRDTGIWELRNRRLSELSGGERQRVILASALAQEPRFLLLDEPTSALDIKHQVQFFRILQKLHAERKIGVAIITHDINLAIRFCDRLIILSEGSIVGDGAPAEVINNRCLAEVYGVDVQVLEHPDDKRPLVVFR